MFCQIKILIKALRILNSIILRMLYSKMDILIRLIHILIPAGVCLLQIIYKIRSPDIYSLGMYNYGALCIYENGDIGYNGDGIYWDSCGIYISLQVKIKIRSPWTDVNDRYSAYRVRSDGDVGAWNVSSSYGRRIST